MCTLSATKNNFVNRVGPKSTYIYRAQEFTHPDMLLGQGRYWASPRMHGGPSQTVLHRAEIIPNQNHRRHRTVSHPCDPALRLAAHALTALRRWQTNHHPGTTCAGMHTRQKPATTWKNTTNNHWPKKQRRRPEPSCGHKQTGRQMATKPQERGANP